MKFQMITLCFSILALSFAAEARMQYRWPSVGGLPVNNACATPKTFRSIKNVSVCTETGVISREACRPGGETDYCRPLGLQEQPADGEIVHENIGCVQREERRLEVSRVKTTRKCVAWKPNVSAEDAECLKFETVTTVMSQDFKVEVFNETTGEISGSINYHVPNCSR